MSTPPQQPVYEILIEDSLGQFNAITEFTKLEYTHSLNKGTIATLELPLNSITDIEKATRNSWLRVFRKDTAASERRLVWYGKLSESKMRTRNLSMRC